MPVRAPKKSVYYYECSYGNFRLTYFIPYSELEDLYKKDEIDEQVLEDFPDGVDLRVGETDYSDFKKSYGYRPDRDPEVVKNIFYSILSSTKNWKKIRGSGIIPAKDVEKRIDEIIKKMIEEQPSYFEFIKTSPEKVKPRYYFRRVTPEAIFPVGKADLIEYHYLRKKYTKKEKDVSAFLRKIKPEGIDPRKTLLKQKFSEMQWTEGDSIDAVFKRIQHKNLGREVKNHD